MVPAIKSVFHENDGSLVISINDVPQWSYPIVERDIPGRINNEMPWENRWFYYVLIGGKRYR
jgi:hypothetical protein